MKALHDILRSRSITSLSLAFVVLASPSPAQVLSAPAPDWGVQLGTSQSDICRGACSDGQGGTWITGSTAVVIGFNWRTFVQHLDPAGAVLQSVVIDGDGVDHAHAVAPDGLGGVFVCGQTNSPLAGPVVGGGTYDGFLARVDHQGNVLWIRQLGTSASDVAQKVASDGAGGVAPSCVASALPIVPSAGSRARCAWGGHQGESWTRVAGS